MNNQSDTSEILSPSFVWFIINPCFLCLELIIFYYFFNMGILSNDTIVESSFLILFSILYYILDFSEITNFQSSLIFLAAFSQIFFYHNSIEIPNELIPSMLIFSQILLGIIYLNHAKIILNNDMINFKSNTFSCGESYVETRLRLIGGLFGFGEIVIHHENKKIILSGIQRPIEKRRILIDNYGVRPFQQKANWSGTLYLFIISTVVLISPFFLFYSYIFYYLSDLILPLRLIISFILTIFLSILILNIRLPRKKINPASDLLNLKLIDTGMWTEIFQLNDEIVVKQLFRCGWGHNNYNGHKAPIIGEKMCGEKNPIALLIMHNLMLIYQMIGIHRRKLYEHQIEAIPRTYTVSGKPFRYHQEYVPKPLDIENIPKDIESQFLLLNEQLKKSGLYIDDIHAGNVRIDSNGKIKLVDGELYTDGEVFVKNFLVNSIDDRLSGMEPVLGCDRIIRWIDNRLSVDETINRITPEK